MGRKKSSKRKTKEFLKRSKAAKKGWRKRRRRKQQGASRRYRKAPAPKMWRITVSAAYYIRAGKAKNKKGESPDSAAFMVRGWFRSYAEALDHYEDFDAMANEGRDEAVDSHKRAFSREEETNLAIQEVEFEERLLGLVTQEDERL